MKTIVATCFNAYQTIRLPYVMPGVVPIVWFGNIDKYRQSGKKIITVGLYPSCSEFVDPNGNINLNYRFPGVPASYSSTQPISYHNYKKAMDSYFDNNPYTTWFQHYENVLNCFDASYYQGNYNRTALHIDMIAPVAPQNASKNDINQLDTLYNGNLNFFKSMINRLDPDVIVVSASQAVVKAKLGIALSNASMSYTSGQGYIDLHIIKSPVSSKKIGIIWGRNWQTPFACIPGAVLKQHCIVYNNKLVKSGIL